MLAVADDTASSVSLYSVSATTGVLTPLAGSPVPTGAGVNNVTFSHGGSLLATANFNDNSVTVYSVSPPAG